MSSRTLFIPILFLTGCATQPHLATTPLPAAPAPQLLEPALATPATAVTSTANPLVWQASGKLAVRTFNHEGEAHAGTAYFVWQQQGNVYRITLSGPLGQGRTVIEGTPERTTLNSARTGQLQADTPEELMEQSLGWSAPVSYLPKWLQGKSATPQAEEITNDGLLQSALEGQWQADFASYKSIGEQRLPQKIVITGPNTKMTVFVSNWTLN